MHVFVVSMARANDRKYKLLHRDGAVSDLGTLNAACSSLAWFLDYTFARSNMDMLFLKILACVGATCVMQVHDRQGPQMDGLAQV